MSNFFVDPVEQRLYTIFNRLHWICKHDKDTISKTLIDILATSKFLSNSIVYYFSQELELIEFTLIENEGYKKCLEEKKKDKRIKNLKKYCMQRHNPKQMLKINCKKIKELEETWEKLPHPRPSFPDFVLFYQS